MSDHAPLSSGGQVAMVEKTVPGGATAKVEHVSQCAGTSLSTTVVSVGTGTPSGAAIAASKSRVYAQVSPLNGDIYLAGAQADLADATKRRTITASRSWETWSYAGDIFIKAVAGTVNVELEHVT